MVVPKETMVAPMTILGKPVRRARPTTPSIIQSAPFDNSRIQTAIIPNRPIVGNPFTSSCKSASSPIQRSISPNIIPAPELQVV
jgi:hypothetical protein